jgi:uncharacterized protein (TIGR02145 family)
MKIKVKLPGSLLAMAIMFLIMITGCKKDNEPLTVTDIDGNVYKTVVIGTQTWLAENLKTTKYNDGSQIPNVTGKSQWDNLTTDAYCFYNNDASTYKATYGALYNWYAVYTGKLCPTGWHVPSDAEWTALTSFLGDDGYEGGKLKEIGTIHWISPNNDATDQYGFSALPAGDRYPASGFEFWGLGEYCAMWSSTGKDATHAYYREIYNNSGQIYDEYTNVKFGFSVRCIKD